jgi:hypothetical protein
MNHELSDNQRRFLCRVLFLALCLIPTCVTFYCAFHKPTPEQWAQRIHAELGIKTRIGSVETPLPNKVIFKRLRMFDAEDREVVNVLEAKVTLGDENQIQIDVPVQVSRRGMEHFLTESTDRVVRPREGFKPWRVQFADIEILSGEQMDIANEAIRFAPLNALITNSVQGIKAELLTPVAEFDPNHPRWVVCTLERGLRENETKFTFDNSADSQAMPCWLAQGKVTQLERHVGDRAGFKGVAQVWLQQGEPVCELDGTFVNVDLSRHERNYSRPIEGAAYQVRDLVVTDSNYSGTIKIKFPDSNGFYTVSERRRFDENPDLQKMMFSPAIQDTIRDYETRSANNGSMPRDSKLF